MNRFVLDLRNIRREGAARQPVSYMGFLPDTLDIPRPIAHPTIDFGLLLSSSPDTTTQFKIGGRRTPSAKIPAFNFMPPGLLHEPLPVKSDARFELFYFCYHRDLLPRFNFFNADISNYVFEIDLARFTPLIKEALELCENIQGFGNADRLDLLCERIVCEFMLLRKCGLEEAGDLKAVRSIASYLALHFAEPMDIEKMVKRQGLSKRTFLRRWSSLYGESPGRHITRLRLNEAKRLLAHTDASVEEAAERVGVDDPFYFSRLFRKHEGLPPSEFKSNARKALPVGGGAKAKMPSESL